MKPILITIAFMFSIIANQSIASEDIDVNKLLTRIQAMEERIALLESRFSFASFMPDFAERFHVMHRATESEDWAVASHELQEMIHMVETSLAIDDDKGLLFQTMMGPVLEQMDDAIAHANQKKMVSLFDQATQTCNSCHVATGSSFINVTLDATGTLSMRHPHVFSKQKMGKHMH